MCERNRPTPVTGVQQKSVRMRDRERMRKSEREKVCRQEKVHVRTQKHVWDGEREEGEKRKGDKGGREEEEDKVR